MKVFNGFRQKSRSKGLAFVDNSVENVQNLASARKKQRICDKRNTTVLFLLDFGKLRKRSGNPLSFDREYPLRFFPSCVKIEEIAGVVQWQNVSFPS